MSIIGGIGTGLAAISGLANTFGIGNNSSKKQLQQQQALTDMQKEANKELMEDSFAYQKNLYDHTYAKNTAQAQVRNLKAAGLNPALAYGLQGAGGGSTTGSGSASVGGGSASGEAEMQTANTAKQGMALQLAKLSSEVKLNESVAEKNEADAEQAKAKTTTEENSRDILIENMRQEGIFRLQENYGNAFERSWDGENEGDEMSSHNAIYNWNERIKTDSAYANKIKTAINKTIQETNKAAADAINTNTRTENYWKELQNATMHAMAASKTAEATETIAENDKVKAAAQKLAAEFNAGEFTNWKTWTDLTLKTLEEAGGILTKTGGLKKVIK